MNYNKYPKFKNTVDISNDNIFAFPYRREADLCQIARAYVEVYCGNGGGLFSQAQIGKCSFLLGAFYSDAPKLGPYLTRELLISIELGLLGERKDSVSCPHGVLACCSHCYYPGWGTYQAFHIKKEQLRLFSKRTTR